MSEEPVKRKRQPPHTNVKTLFQGVYVTIDLKEDFRHRDVGLSVEEASFVLTSCLKFVTFRDPLEDLYQECLCALKNGFDREKARNNEITYRKGYIRSVTRNTLTFKCIKQGGRGGSNTVAKKDLIYCCNTPYNFTLPGSEEESTFDTLTVEDVESRNIPCDMADYVTLVQTIKDTLTEVEYGVFMDSVDTGLFHKEIAEKYDMPKEDVGKILARVRSKLRDALASCV